MVNIQYDPMASVRYSAVGTCIYCGANSDLTDEHVIPYGMGGRWVLPESSCTDCAAITSRFEGSLLRSAAWWPLRRALGIVSRHPARQPDGFEAEQRRGPAMRVVTVPLGRHPLLIPIFRFDPPALLTGHRLPPGGDVTVLARGVELLPLRPLLGLDGGEIGWASNATGPTTTTFRASLEAADVARLVAKVGWSWAVARYGLDAFSKVYVRALILGDASAGNTWFGELFTRPRLFSRDLHVVGEIRHGDDLAVWIQMFRSSIHDVEVWPAYQVVVGQLNTTIGTTT